MQPYKFDNHAMLMVKRGPAIEAMDVEKSPSSVVSFLAGMIEGATCRKDNVNAKGPTVVLSVDQS